MCLRAFGRGGERAVTPDPGYPGNYPKPSIEIRLFIAPETPLPPPLCLSPINSKS